MTQQDAIKLWREAARDAFKTARVLKAKKRGHHALFFCHLAIEKLLKGLIIKKTGKLPPFIHDLRKLAERAELELSDANRKELTEITSFNIAARYDDEKKAFMKRARGKYFTHWFPIAERYFRWLQSLY